MLIVHVTTTVIDIWNALPEEMMESNTITAFKRYLHWHLKRQGREGQGNNADK